jgi:hypothetical protein
MIPGLHAFEQIRIKKEKIILCFLKVNSLDCNTIFTSLKKLHKTVFEGTQRNCIEFGGYIVLDS